MVVLDGLSKYNVLVIRKVGENSVIHRNPSLDDYFPKSSLAKDLRGPKHPRLPSRHHRQRRIQRRLGRLPRRDCLNLHPRLWLKTTFSLWHTPNHCREMREMGARMMMDYGALMKTERRLTSFPMIFEL